MNSIERFFATVERKYVDRPACWLGMPEVHSLKALYEHFGVSDMSGLKSAIDDDIYPIEIPYHSPTSNAIYNAFNFSKTGLRNNEQRTLTVPGFFEDYDDPGKVDDFNWIDPAKYVSVEECKMIAENTLKDKAILGILWSAHFQDTCAAFGMETALMIC